MSKNFIFPTLIYAFPFDYVPITTSLVESITHQKRFLFDEILKTLQEEEELVTMCEVNLSLLSFFRQHFSAQRLFQKRLQRLYLTNYARSKYTTHMFVLLGVSADDGHTQKYLLTIILIALRVRSCVWVYVHGFSFLRRVRSQAG